MDLRHLRHFLAIAEAGSVSKAADQLGLAQPALSLSLSRLEKELGVRLFFRSRRGAQLTDAGQALVEDAAAAVAKADAMTRLARRLAVGQAGELRIGFISSALYDLLPQALARLKAAIPEVSVVLEEMNSTVQLRALQEGRIDVGFSRAPVAAARQVREKIVSSSPLIAAVPDDFPQGRNGSVALERIAEYGLILAPETQGAVRARILYAIRRAGAVPRIVQEANRGLTMLSCVSAGLGVALLPESVRALTFAGVRFCTVVPEVLPRLDISVLWRASSRPTLADRFVSLIAARRK